MMAHISIGLPLLLGLLPFLLSQVEADLTRITLPDADELDKFNATEESDVGYGEIEYTWTDSNSEEIEGGGGVLDRLSTGRGNLAGTGKDYLDERLRRFRHDSAFKMQGNMESLMVVRQRHRRAHALDSELTRDTKGYYKLASLETNVNRNLRAFAVPSDYISMVVFEHLDFVFWLVTENYNENDLGRLHVYFLHLGTNTLLSDSVATLGADKCVPVLLLDTFIEIVCVETQADRFAEINRKGGGSGVFRITWAGGLNIVFLRALKTWGARDVAVWWLGGTTYLTFANSYDKVRQSGEIRSVVFQLQTTVLSGDVYTSYDQLDGASFGTKHAVGVEAFKIVSQQFVAVANHQDDQGNVEIESGIFRYNLHKGRLDPFQRIKTSAARDWTAFSFVNGPNSEFFLAVANEYKYNEDGSKNYEVDSVIYKFDEGKFVPFQCIRTFGALEWVAYQGPNGELILAVVNSKSGVAFYGYNGWRFIRSSINLSGPGVERVWIARLPNTLNEVVLTVANPLDAVDRPEIVYLRFVYKNPLAAYHEATLEWCTKRTTKVTNDNLEQLVVRANEAVGSFDPNNFSFPVTILGSLTVRSPVSYVFEVVVAGLDGSYAVDYGFNNAFALLINRRDEAVLKLARVVNLYNIAEKISFPRIGGNPFSRLKLECRTTNQNTCIVDNLIVGTINGIRVSFDNAIRIGSSLDVFNLTLEHVVVSGGGVVTVNTITGGGLNEIPVSHFVTLTNDYTITGIKTFVSIKACYLQVSGTVDSVRINEDTVLLTVTEQRISSKLIVDSLSTVDINLLYLNGINFIGFYNNLVLNGTTQDITGVLIVNGNLVAPSVTTLRPLVPLDPVTVLNTALFHTTTSTQEITGIHVFQTLRVDVGLTVTGHVNNIRIPDDLFSVGTQQIITQPVTFTSVSADSIQLQGPLGNIQNLNGEYDLLLVNGDQTVSGVKVFDQVTILSDSSVTGTVSGFDLRNLTNVFKGDIIGGISAGRRIEGSVTFKNDLFIFDGLLDGVRINRIRDFGLRLDSVQIDVPIIFDSPNRVNGDFAVLSSLNGVDIQNFILRDQSYTVRSDLTFTSDLKIQGNIQVGDANGHNLTELLSQLASLIDQDLVFDQDITFHDVTTSDITILGGVTVNGVDLEDLVLLNSTDIITGEKTFTTVTVFSDVNARAVNVGAFGTVDGVIFNELFFADTLRKTGTSVQNLVGRRLNVLTVPSITGTDLAAFERTVVYKDTNEVVEGSWEFTGPVTIDELTFSGSFDGVSDEDYNSAWLLKDGSQTLTGINSILNVDAGDVLFTGSLVQQTDLDLLLRATVKIDEATTLTSVSFENIISEGNVTLEGTIQGWKLREHSLLSNVDLQVVTGLKRFRFVLNYSGELNVAGYVVVFDSLGNLDPLPIDVGLLCERVITDTSTIVLEDLLIEGTVNFGNGMNITVSLNGESVSSLEEIFWLTDIPNFTCGVDHFVFAEVAANASVQLDGQLVPFETEDLNSRVLKKNCDSQIVDGKYHIESLTVENLSTDLLTNPDDDLGIIRLQNILLKDGDQVITGRITLPQLATRGSVILDGTLNGLIVEEHLVRYNRPAIITARKTFQAGLTIQGDLIVQDESTVQNVDVSELAKLAVFINGEDTRIFGTTSFFGLRLEDILEVAGTVDGIQVNSSTVLLRQGDQEVTGLITINAGTFGLALVLTSSLEITDTFFRDISLARLVNFTVRIDRTNVITSSVTFQVAPSFTDVTCQDYLINGYNLTVLGICLKQNRIVDKIGDEYASILQLARDAEDILDEQFTELWYFEEQPIPSLHKLQPILLTGNYLVSTTFDTIAGLDLTSDSVYTYDITTNFSSLYDPITVLGPVAVAGLGNNLLATCGSVGMPATSPEAPPTQDYSLIPLEAGEDYGYGHVHSLAGDVGIEAAFGILQCKDLVSFRLADNRFCLAVLDYEASSTVLCGTVAEGFQLLNYLGTNRAVKGSWIDIAPDPYLIVAEEESSTSPGYLKIFKHDTTTDKMVLITIVDVVGASDVHVASVKTWAFIVVTVRPSRRCKGLVLIFKALITSNQFVIKTIQTLEVERVVHSTIAVLPSEEFALVIQTQRSLQLYLWKGITFVFFREIRTSKAVCPYSYPFVYEVDHEFYIIYSGYGSLSTTKLEATWGIAPSVLYRAVYRGSAFYFDNKL